MELGLLRIFLQRLLQWMHDHPMSRRGQLDAGVGAPRLNLVLTVIISADYPEERGGRGELLIELSDLAGGGEVVGSGRLVAIEQAEPVEPHDLGIHQRQAVAMTCDLGRTDA